ncbi:MAG: SusE domain-containing protein [Alistipes sp.]|nr:SusE domain-containing protein [Alistipes sp.]
MNQFIRHIALTILFAAPFWIGGCNKENDFHEVGRQPVTLTRPEIDTVILLDYEQPDSLFTFAWSSRRHFIDYKLRFGLDEHFTTSCERNPGVGTSWRMTTMQLDSLLSSMNVAIGATVPLYWTVEVVDPEVGWCDEIRRLTVTRCDLPTNPILLRHPANEAEIGLDRKTPDAEIRFEWECASAIPDCTLRLGLDAGLADDATTTVDCTAKSSHLFTMQELDDWLAGQGVEPNAEAAVYWQVTGTGDLNNPIESSAVRTATLRRMTKAPVPLTLAEPAPDAELLLDADRADETVRFAWQCDTTGVDYTLRLYDAEFDRSATLETGEATGYEISQADLDLLLEQTFGMVASQKKRFAWSVTPSDPDRAEAADGENGRPLVIRRFEAVTAADPILLAEGPEDGAAYVLDYDRQEETLAAASWSCNARGVTYALEYSLSEEMSEARTRPLTTEKSAALTHALLDEMLTELDGAYLTRTIYWRVTSTISIKTIPSETRRLTLTGMLRPFTDLRDPEAPERYAVVRIGDDIWMAENLRALSYSDGTAFTTVDAINGRAVVKTFANDLIGDPRIRGVYYSWPTALRTYEQATAAEDTRMQGVCPDGWHVSTKQEWQAVQAAADYGASRIKSAGYWSGNTGTDELGLNIVPAGQFWHGNVAAPDSADERASFWTTTSTDSTTAWMFEVFGWSNEIVPWNFNARPWCEGDGTASKLVNVRCVRDRD